MASPQDYSLSKLPGSGAQIVISERSRLLGAIDLEALVDDLGRLGNCVRIAYHGVAGYTDLQIKIQRIGYDVTKLCDKSAITVGQFKKASSTILHTLQSTYEYLLDSLEDMAVETLADITETAKGMADAAEALHREFDDQSKKVICALEETQETQGMEQEKKKKLQEEREQMEVDYKVELERRNAALELERKYEQLYQQAAEEENDAVKEQTGFFKNLINGITFGLIDPLDAYKDKATAARAEKAKHLELLNKQQEERRQALMKLAEFTEKMSQNKNNETRVNDAIIALQSAIGALKTLSAVMLQAATFWLQMQRHCEELANEKLKKDIERILKLPEERRLQVWNSNGFKRRAVKYYAGWVALDDVCTVYMERIKLTQRELYTYIQEALLPDEAYKKVKELAKSFNADLINQQQAIADKQFKHNEQIKALKSQ
jgi:hypothetical protein